MQKGRNVFIITLVLLAGLVFIAFMVSSSLKRYFAKIDDGVKDSSWVRIERDSQGWWWVLDKEKISGLAGVVYQPVPEDKHPYFDFMVKNDYARLYRPLLDRDEGGLGHARKLRDIGVRVIRIYALNTEDNGDIERTKRIFRRVYEKYGLRVLVGNWCGLYTYPDDESRIRQDVERMVKIYNSDSWVLGWQLGNENNYYYQRGRFGTKIDKTPEEYYRFMNSLVVLVKRVESEMGVEHPIGIGVGIEDYRRDRELALIAQYAKDIDFVGINYLEGDVFRIHAPQDFKELLKAVDKIVNKPVIISEFGIPSHPVGEEYQAKYNRAIWLALSNNAAGRGGVGNFLATFVCEVTDQEWKKREPGMIESEGYWGIFGKPAEEMFRPPEPGEKVDISIPPEIKIDSDYIRIEKNRIVVADFEGVTNIVRYGDAEGSGFTTDTAHSGKVAYKLLNSGPNLGWASVILGFYPYTTLDVSGYKYLSFWVRGLKGGEKIGVSFVDERRQYEAPAGLKISSPLATEWQQVHIPLEEISRDVNLKKLIQITILFGCVAWDRELNPSGAVLFIDDVEFTNSKIE